MKKWLLFLSLFVVQTTLCFGQQVPEALVYQLAEAILNDLSTQAISSAKKDADGKFYRVQPMPTDTPFVSLILLERPYWIDDGKRFLGAARGTPEHEALLTHFTLADIQYMQEQLPEAERFKFQPTKIRKSWVHVLTQDTLNTLSNRLKKQWGWEHVYKRSDFLFQRFGNSHIGAIGPMVFAKNYKSALALVYYASVSNIIVYRNRGGSWEKEDVLYTIIE